MGKKEMIDDDSEIGPIAVGDLVEVKRWFKPQNAGQKAYTLGFVRKFDVDENNPPVLAVVAHEEWIGVGVGPREIALIKKADRQMAERLRSRYEQHKPGQLLPTRVMPAPFELAQYGPGPILTRLKQLREEGSDE